MLRAAPYDWLTARQRLRGFDQFFDSAINKRRLLPHHQVTSALDDVDRLRMQALAQFAAARERYHFVSCSPKDVNGRKTGGRMHLI